MITMTWRFLLFLASSSWASSIPKSSHGRIFLVGERNRTDFGPLLKESHLNNIPSANIFYPDETFMKLLNSKTWPVQQLIVQGLGIDDIERIKRILAKCRQAISGIAIMTDDGDLSFSELPSSTAAKRHVNVASGNVASALTPELAGRSQRLLQIATANLGLTSAFSHAGVSINECVGLVGNGSADVCISTPAFSWRRYQVAEISYPVFERALVFIYKLPDQVNTFETLVNPMSFSVWILTLLSIMAVFVTLLILSMLDKRFANGIQKLKIFNIATISTAPLISEALPEQHFSVTSYLKWSTQVVLFCWIPTACLISMAYRSILLASLVRVEYEKPIDTFEDILASDVILSIPWSTQTPRLMRTSPRKVVRDVFEKNVMKLGGKDDWESRSYRAGLDLGTHATMARSPGLEGIRDKYRPGRDALQVSYAGWMYKFGFGWRAQFDFLILRLQDAGIIWKLRQREAWNRAKPERERLQISEMNADETPAIDLDQMLLLWVLYAVGIVLSTVALVVNVWRERNGKNRTNNRRALKLQERARMATIKSIHS